MTTDVAAPLPQLDLPPNATITVTLDDPLAVLTSLVIHGWQDEPVARFVPPEPLLAATPPPLPAEAV